MLDQLFGGKKWYKSMTGWATLILIVAWEAVPAMGEIGLVSPELAATMTEWLTKASVPLGVLGIRRKLPT